ncbi:MAG: hypothetical protein AB1486_04045 [Planctomycetota bacterium]
MLTLITGLILTMSASQDDGAQLTKLCKDFTQVESYTFQVVTKTEGSGFMGGGGRGGRGGGDASPQPVQVDGQFKKGEPVHLKSGDVEAYRVGDATVNRNAEGKWQLFDREAMRGAFGQRGQGRGEPGAEPRGQGRGDQGGGQQGGGEGAGQAGAGRAPGGMAPMRTLMTMSRVALPHDALQKIEGKLTDVKEERQEGKVIYSANLTSEGAQALAAFSGFGRMRGGDQAPNFEYSGSIRVVATAEGVIEKIEITTKTKGSMGERDFERTQLTTFTLDKIGKTEYQVPEEAKAAFEV